MMSLQDVLEKCVEVGIIPGDVAQKILENLKKLGVPHFEDWQRWGFVWAECSIAFPDEGWEDASEGFVFDLVNASNEEIFVGFEEVAEREGLQEVTNPLFPEGRAWADGGKIVALEVPWCSFSLPKGRTAFFNEAILGDLSYFIKKGYHLCYDIMGPDF